MNIIVFVNADGQAEEGICNHREIEICEEDEGVLRAIIGRALGSYHTFEEVRVLTEQEYTTLSVNGSQWTKYQEWLKAKEIYKQGKVAFETPY